MNAAKGAQLPVVLPMPNGKQFCTMGLFGNTVTVAAWADPAESADTATADAISAVNRVLSLLLRAAPESSIPVSPWSIFVDAFICSSLSTRPSCMGLFYPARLIKSRESPRWVSATVAPRWHYSVGRQVLVPIAERPERRPELALGFLGVERVVDVGDVERGDRRGQLLQLAERRLERAAHRNVELVERLERPLPHDDHAARLHDRELLDHPLDALAGGEGRVRHRALHAQRPVDRQRVDTEPLEALHQRVAGAPVEGHPLLDLRGGGGELEQHHVGLRMTGAEHRHQVAARAVRALLETVRELVELADRALEVLLLDLVVCRRHRRSGRAPRAAVLL